MKEHAQMDTSIEAFVYSTCLKLSQDEISQLKNLNSELINRIKHIESTLNQQLSQNSILIAQNKTLKDQNRHNKYQNTPLNIPQITKFLFPSLGSMGNAFKLLKNEKSFDISRNFT